MRTSVRVIMDGDSWYAFSTNQKGAIAEAEISRAAAWAGMDVYRPLFEHGRADLVLDTARGLLRVQCKWGQLSDGVVQACLSTSRFTPSNGYVRTTYGADEIDAVAVYCAGLDKCYLLPVALIAGQTYINLRVDPSKNNQRLGLKWARDYELGAIAQ
jgi:hypothetical protein